MAHQSLPSCPGGDTEVPMCGDLPPLATSWRPSEENQWVDSSAGGQWGEDNRLVRQLVPSHPRAGAGPLGTDQVGKMPYKTLSELGLHRNSELWTPILLVLEDRQGCCNLHFQGEGSLVQRKQSWPTGGVTG